MPQSSIPIGEPITNATLLAIALRCYQVSKVNRDKYLPSFMAALGREDLQEVFEWFRINYWPGLPPEDRPRLYGYRDPFDFNQEGAFIHCVDTLMNYFKAGLGGVRLGIRYSNPDGWQHAFECKSLLSVMWLQLQQVILKGTLVRECEGCSRLFEATRENQVFHDDHCRGATADRRRYRTKKEAN